ncbi:MAG: hypothetical protein JWO36_4971 [Myxococcales bacterium]|nr:hypothetical protein [Myxococcales bacterium]
MRVRDHASGFESPPAELVEGGRQRLGRFDAPPMRANLIDAPYLRLPRVLRRWRLKEWQALQITTPRLFANIALFDAKLLQLLQVKVYDRRREHKYLHERQLRPGSFHIADQVFDSDTAYRDRKSELAFHNRFATGRIEIDLAVSATADCPQITGHLVVHTARGASQVVSLPFAGDVGMYSHKGMFPIEGELAIGDERHILTTDDALALLDDHKGYYPYVMRWDWVTSATHDTRGRALGFNLTHNQCRDPDRFNENCAWIGDQIGRLPAVTFERGDLWRIRDREGRVDLTFEPTVPGDVRLNAIVVESRYRGPFGRFTGRLSPEALEPIEIDGWFGMGEQFWLRC